MLDLNFSSVPDRKPLDPGIYVFQIEKAEETMSSTNKPMIKVQFKELESGSRVFENYVIQENTLFKLKALMKVLGYDVTSDLSGFNAVDLEGQMVRAQVELGEYQGEPRNVIKKLFAE